MLDHCMNLHYFFLQKVIKICFYAKRQTFIMGVLHEPYRVGLIAEQNEFPFSVYIYLHIIYQRNS